MPLKMLMLCRVWDCGCIFIRWLQIPYRLKVNMEACPVGSAVCKNSLRFCVNGLGWPWAFSAKFLRVNSMNNKLKFDGLLFTKLIT